MYAMVSDLSTLKDDMTAFVEGHGMRRFHGYVEEEVQSVMWNSEDNPDGWKDFVELAKAAGAPFVTTSDVVLEGDDIDDLIDRLSNSNYINDDDVEDARLLRTNIGKTGFIQLGFPHQGTMFLYEISTEWYERYQRLIELADEFGGFVIDDTGGEDDDR